MRQQRDFPNAARSVGAARRYVIRVLTGTHAAELPDVIDVIGVLVSELATNCVRHAQTQFTVGVEDSSGSIRIEVSDLGDGMPVVAHPTARELSGRGLQLVEAFADGWGVTARRGSGKTVWFTVALPGPRRDAGHFASLGA